MNPIAIASRQTFTGVSSTSTPVSIANWPQWADWTLFLTVSGAFAGSALVSIEDSLDNFVADIQVVATLNVTGPVTVGTYISHSWRSRELPSYRVGELGATTRISVTSTNSAASVTLAIAEIK